MSAKDINKLKKYGVFEPRTVIVEDTEYESNNLIKPKNEDGDQWLKALRIEDAIGAIKIKTIFYGISTTKVGIKFWGVVREKGKGKKKEMNKTKTNKTKTMANM